MPAKAELPDIKQLKKLCEKHNTDPFNARDRGLIACVSFASFDLVDLSLIKVNEVIRQDGTLYDETYIPAEYSALNKPKLVYIGSGTYFRRVLLDVIEWRLSNNLGLLDRGLYCALNPMSCFFLQDDGSEFGVHYRDQEGRPAAVEPYDMRRHFNKFYLGEGINWQLLNYAFMMNYWKAKSPDKPAQAVKDLVAMTAVDAATIRKKCARNEETIQSVLEDLYR